MISLDRDHVRRALPAPSSAVYEFAGRSYDCSRPLAHVCGRHSFGYLMRVMGFRPVRCLRTWPLNAMAHRRPSQGCSYVARACVHGACPNGVRTFADER